MSSDERVVFACPGCGCAVTAPLHPLPADQRICQTPGLPAVPRGYFAVIEGEIGSVMVNLEDLVGVHPHPDEHRHAGCCGRDGLDGPNVVCEQGHEIATEGSDCWMPHSAVLVPAINRAT